MRRIASLVALAALAITAPLAASADPGGRGHGHGRGDGWRAGDRGADRGDGPRGRFERGGGFDRGGFDRDGDRGGGRWRDRSDGPGRWNDGEPPRSRNSLGEGWREQQNEAREGVRRGGYRPLGNVLSDLRRRQPGRQLDAGLEEGRDGRPVYRVRWAAQNGQRIDYIVDARTGQILAEEGR